MLSLPVMEMGFRNEGYSKVRDAEVGKEGATDPISPPMGNVI